MRRVKKKCHKEPIDKYNIEKYHQGTNQKVQHRQILDNENTKQFIAKNAVNDNTLFLKWQEVL